MEDANSDQLKVMAAHVSEVAVEDRRQLLEEHSASFRWLMASFFALNGAGMIGLKDFGLIDPTSAFIAGSALFLGM